jgi:hypothetical protein
MKPLSQVNPNAPYDFDAHNEIFKKWVPKVRSALKSKATRFTKGKTQSFVIRGKQMEGKLSSSIQVKTKREGGAVELVSFSFERHGVFIHKGVGRGYEMSSGFVIRTAKSGSTAERHPQEWFNPTLDDFIPELANRLAKINLNATLNATGVKIKNDRESL